MDSYLSSYCKSIDSKISPKTLHKLYYEILLEPKPKASEIALVVDEVSTLSYSILHLVVRELCPHRLYFFGDEKQLPPILGQHLLSDLLEYEAKTCAKFVVRLNTIHRGNGTSAELASKMWLCDNDDAVREWIRDLESCSSVTWVKEPTVQAIVSTAEGLFAKGDVYKDYPLVMAPTNDVVRLLNRKIRPLWLRKTNKSSYNQYTTDLENCYEGRQYATVAKKAIIGDRVMCTKNVYELKTKQGKVGRNLTLLTSRSTTSLKMKMNSWKVCSLQRIRNRPPRGSSFLLTENLAS